jgi:L-threonylcarbamoyladenylate synthase
MRLRVVRFGEEIGLLQAAVSQGIPLVIPTESSYALGVNPASEAGVAAVYRLKERDPRKPLLVVAADRDQVLSLGVLESDPGFLWALARWPAPLTVVFDLERPLPASAGTRSLAVRVPDAPELRSLLREIGCPLTATSANRSGEAALVDPEAVVSWLCEESCILVDAGRLPGGEPSTLVRWVDGRLEVLRRGRYPV